jgi:hypothetical protein
MSEVQDKCDLVINIRLHVSFEDALEMLRKVKHPKFESSLEAAWRQGEDGNVIPQGKCWFFCWGWSGNTSDTTAEVCKDLWNKIFEKDYNYNWFDRNIGIAFAREYRARKWPNRL